MKTTIVPIYINTKRIRVAPGAHQELINLIKGMTHARSRKEKNERGKKILTAEMRGNSVLLMSLRLPLCSFRRTSLLRDSGLEAGCDFLLPLFDSTN